jgi:hypothetical protein
MVVDNMHIQRINREDGENAVTGLLEYVWVTGILLILFIFMIILANAVFIEEPSNALKYHSYVDIGNGISVRVVDLYLIAPGNGTIVSKFDIPDDVVGQDYFVELDKEKEGVAQRIIVTDYQLRSTISLSGIGATRAVTGQTTGAGMNVITYNSSGV